jgi:acetylornithine deacetylase/succinyl-diaminopimelate desuccinylase-like protein
MSKTIDSEKINHAFEYALKKLEEWVEIPSISNPHFDQSNVEKSAEFVKSTLEDLGFEARIAKAKIEGEVLGAPAVIGHKIVDPKLPTVLLYAHHDVQPVNSPADWNSDPFTPTQKDGRLYGRGSADDGGGLASHFGALKYWGENLPVNVKLLIEGEEEIGSPSFANFVQDFESELRADYYIIADSGELELGVPSLTTTLRGVITVSIEVRVLEHDVHSGQFSGPILDPFILVSKLVASLHDDQGELQVPGLISYDDGVELDSESAYRADGSVVNSVRLSGSGTLSSRLSTKPTATFIGLNIPKFEEASNTIAPVAKAKLSIRTAPGQDNLQAFAAVKAHLEKVDILGAELKISLDNSGSGYKADLNAKSIQAAKSAYREVWGKETQLVGQGGSIPLTEVIQSHYPNAEILVTSAEDPDSRAHSANESIDLNELKNFVESETLLLEKLAQ